MPTKREIEKIRAKFVDGPERYQNLTFEELDKYYRFAIGGHIVGKAKFIYADAQSMAKYVDGELLLKYLSELQNRNGKKAASDEVKRLQSCGYLYTFKVGEREFLCTSEGQQYLKNKYPSN